MLIMFATGVIRDSLALSSVRLPPGLGLDLQAPSSSEAARAESIVIEDIETPSAIGIRAVEAFQECFRVRRAWRRREKAIEVVDVSGFEASIGKLDLIE